MYGHADRDVQGEEVRYFLITFVVLAFTRPSLAQSSGGTDGTGTATTSISTVSSSINCASVIFQNDPASTTNIKVGYSSSAALTLIPGASITLNVTTLNVVNFKAASGSPTYNWACAN